MSKNGKLIFKNFAPYVTSPFGNRIHPITKQKSFHQGVDYGTNDEKKPQYAIESGKVTGCGTDNTGAKYVYVEYPRLGYTGLHYHLDNINVSNGQNVDENTIIGWTGQTGQATGIHLHFGWFKTSDRYKSWNEKGWEDFEAYDYKKEETKPINPTTQKFEIGQEVIINGDLYVSSDANVPAGKVNNKTTYITRYVKGAKHPYNTTGDLGWMDEKDIKLVDNNKVVYIVKKGDTLSGIAKKYGTTWQKIYENNKSVIGNNPDLIKPGQKLII